MGPDTWKLLWRNLRKNKLSSILNYIGLTIGFSSVIVIGLYVYTEGMKDAFHKHADDTAIIVLKGSLGEGQEMTAPLSSAAMGPAMVRELAAVENYVRVNPWNISRLVTVDDQTYKEKYVLFTDSTFFDVFDFKLVVGDPKDALRRPFSAVLCESSAKKIFGDQDPLGQKFMMNNDPETIYTVTGIVEDVIQPTHFPPFNMLCSWSSQGINETDWTESIGWSTYLQMQKGYDKAEVEKQINDLINQHIGEVADQNGWNIEFSLMPLRDLYLDSGSFDHYGYWSGSRPQVIQFLVIGLFILLIACLNFINLTTARSVMKSRLVGMCRILGASRRRMVNFFLTESVFFSLMAMIPALVITWYVLPQFGQLVRAQIPFMFLDRPLLIVLVLFFAILVGLLAGLYPSLYLSAVNPMDVIRNQFRSGRKGAMLRKTLVVLQFAISGTLLICALVVMSQMDYIRKKDLGYEAEHVLLVQLRGDQLRSRMLSLQYEFDTVPGVKNATTGISLPLEVVGAQSYHIPGTPQESQFMIWDQWVGHEYLDVFDIELLDGRPFDPARVTDSTNAIIINETAAKRLGWEDPVGKQLEILDTSPGGQNVTVDIIGLVKDYNFNTLHNEIEPLALMIQQVPPNWLFIRIQSDDLTGTIDAIKEKWATLLPDNPIDAYFLDRFFNTLYHHDVRIGTIFKAFTLLAMFIAVLGLFALAQFSSEQRTMEIGIRKVLGATTSRVWWMMVYDILKLVLYANLLAWPLGFFLMDRWLSDFAYRVSFGWYLLPLTAVMMLVVGLVAVSGQTFYTARQEPARVLKEE